MGVTEILAQIDREIVQLQRARALLNGNNNGHHSSSGHRQLTPEGRRRISEAVKRRWAKQRKAAGAK